MPAFLPLTQLGQEALPRKGEGQSPMRNNRTGIDELLQQVLGHVNDKSDPATWNRQSSPGHRCPRASDVAVHLIIEPYDQGLTQVANINRISTNLELAAEELLYLSKRVRALSMGWRCVSRQFGLMEPHCKLESA